LREALDAELERLLVGTNEQRRRVGQALYHFYRSLVFWSARGRSFVAIAAAWSAAGAGIFDALATTLRELPPHAPDARLRRFVRDVLLRLAADLERGDHMLVPFLRWIETRFPELTAMMQAESRATAIHDFELARELTGLFRLVARGERAEMVRLLRGAIAA
jgi:hypothetical protein